MPGRKFTGTVVSNKMDKSVVVVVARQKQHPLYRKQYQRTRKFVAHDPDNAYQVGDTVQISETRPLSKRKHWLVDKVFSRGQTEEAE